MSNNRWARYLEALLYILGALAALYFLYITFLQNQKSIYQFLNRLFPNFASIFPNFTTVINVVNFSDAIAVLALFISVLALLNERRSTKLNQQMYHDQQLEKARRRLSVSLDKIFKDNPSEWPSYLWGTQLLINNRSEEPAFLRYLVITLEFWRTNFYISGIPYLLRNGHEKVSVTYAYLSEEFNLSAYRYSVGAAEPKPDLHRSEFDHIPAFLINWESKKPVYIGSHHSGLDPGKKEYWMFFGFLPYDFSKELEKTGFDLFKIILEIETDIQDFQLIGETSTTQRMTKSYRQPYEEIARDILAE